MAHKLLLADDSVTIQKVVELTFSEEDFEIISVSDGSQAFDRIREVRPDAILSDVIMPGLNGYELCAKVKADEELKHIPFIFLRGTFESFDEERANAAGADAFIIKPFESQELVDKVKGLIEKGVAAPEPVAATPGEIAGAPGEEPSFEEFGIEEVAEPETAGVGAEFETPEAGASAEDLWSEVKASDHPIPTAEGEAETLGVEEVGIEEEVFGIAPEEEAPVGEAEAPVVEEAPVIEEAPVAGEEAPVFEEAPAFEGETAVIEEPEMEVMPLAEEPLEPGTAEAAPPVPSVQPSADDLRRALAEEVREVLTRTAPDIIREVTRQVISEVVWEVVPDVAEKLIKQEIERLTGGGTR